MLAEDPFCVTAVQWPYGLFVSQLLWIISRIVKTAILACYGGEFVFVKFMGIWELRDWIYINWRILANLFPYGWHVSLYVSKLTSSTRFVKKSGVSNFKTSWSNTTFSVKTTSLRLYCGSLVSIFKVKRIFACKVKAVKLEWESNLNHDKEMTK